MPLRLRCGYAAVFPRSLPGGSCLPPRKFPARHERQVRAAPGPDPPGSSRCRIKGVSHAGSSRTPLRPACRTRAIWQSWHVPALSGLLPPSPASPGSGCPQLRRPAATGSAAKVSHLHSNHCASRRTHDLRHTGNNLTAAAGANLRELMTRMGHSSTRAALIYLHSTDERQREIADALGDLAAGQLQRRPGKARGNRSGTQRARRRRNAS